mmetsp:Transcript_32418/g.102986  ORF Transcript_32418/g.102986 Transcript_32418/m.102986 type:complete len:347 (-) Transcript_32418:7-1047(-)
MAFASAVCVRQPMCVARGKSSQDDQAFAGGDGPSGGEVVLRIVGALAAEPVATVRASLDGTLGDVKELVERCSGIPVVEQRLILGSNCLCMASSDQALYSGDSRRLQEALGLEAVPGATVDVTLLRVAPAWAQLREALREGQLSLEELDEVSRADRELVLVAVAHDGHQLAHASEDLRADRQVVLAAIDHDAFALEFASAELQADRQVALRAIYLAGVALQFASEELRADPEVVFAAMRTSWRALGHASDRLKSDKVFMLAAVCEHGSALCFAAPELKADREVVLAAVSSSGWALSCASEALRSDRECVVAAVTANPAALDFAEEVLRPPGQPVPSGAAPKLPAWV